MPRRRVNAPQSRDQTQSTTGKMSRGDKGSIDTREAKPLALSRLRHAITGRGSAGQEWDAARAGTAEHACAFASTMLLQNAVSGELGARVPWGQSFPGVCMMADVSGFTMLTEELGREGPLGLQKMCRILNRYFAELVAVITAHGGDIVKFAGDALIIVWHPKQLGMTVRTPSSAPSAAAGQSPEFYKYQQMYERHGRQRTLAEDVGIDNKIAAVDGHTFRQNPLSAAEAQDQVVSSQRRRPALRGEKRHKRSKSTIDRRRNPGIRRVQSLESVQPQRLTRAPLASWQKTQKVMLRSTIPAPPSRTTPARTAPRGSKTPPLQARPTLPPTTSPRDECANNLHNRHATWDFSFKSIAEFMERSWLRRQKSQSLDGRDKDAKNKILKLNNSGGGGPLTNARLASSATASPFSLAESPPHTAHMDWSPRRPRSESGTMPWQDTFVNFHSGTLRPLALAAVKCGVAILETLCDYKATETVRLDVHLGVACGQLTQMVLGDARTHLEHVVAGGPIHDMAIAETLSKSKQLVVSPLMWGLIQDSVLPSELKRVKTANQSEQRRLTSLTRPFRVLPAHFRLAPETVLLQRRGRGRGKAVRNATVPTRSRRGVGSNGVTKFNPFRAYYRGLCSFATAFPEERKLKNRVGCWFLSKSRRIRLVHVVTESGAEARWCVQRLVNQATTSAWVTLLQTSKTEHSNSNTTQPPKRARFAPPPSGRGSPGGSPARHVRVFCEATYGDECVSLGAKVVASEIQKMARARIRKGSLSVLESFLPRHVTDVLHVDHTHTTEPTETRSDRSDPALTTASTARLSAMRTVTVLFINLVGVPLAHYAAKNQHTLSRAQRSFSVVQKAIVYWEGTVNKLMVDDKGVVVLALFGLPCLRHPDDAARGVLAALTIAMRFREENLDCSIGIVTGRAFCGVVGSPLRREYTAMGDAVNFAARLMAHGDARSRTVLCDVKTHRQARHRVAFSRCADVCVKGQSAMKRVYQARGVREGIIPPLSALPRSFDHKKTPSPRRPAPSAPEKIISIRWSEKRRLARCVQECVLAGTGLILVTGVHGIGKTALKRFVERAAAVRGCKVCVSNPFDLGLSATHLLPKLSSSGQLIAWKSVLKQLLDIIHEKKLPKKARALNRKLIHWARGWVCEETSLCERLVGYTERRADAGRGSPGSAGDSPRGFQRKRSRTGSGALVGAHPARKYMPKMPTRVVKKSPRRRNTVGGSGQIQSRTKVGHRRAQHPHHSGSYKSPRGSKGARDGSSRADRAPHARNRTRENSTDADLPRSEPTRAARAIGAIVALVRLAARVVGARDNENKTLDWKSATSSAKRPLFMVLDECHLFDDCSWDLVGRLLLLRGVAVCLLMRPDWKIVSELQKLRDSLPYYALNLGPLTYRDAALLVQAELGVEPAELRAHKRVLEMILNLSGCNPLFIKMLCRRLQQTGGLGKGMGALVPTNSLGAPSAEQMPRAMDDLLVLQFDNLTKLQQIIVKVLSVVDDAIPCRDIAQGLGVSVGATVDDGEGLSVTLRRIQQNCAQMLVEQVIGVQFKSSQIVSTEPDLFVATSRPRSGGSGFGYMDVASSRARSDPQRYSSLPDPVQVDASVVRPPPDLAVTRLLNDLKTVKYTLNKERRVGGRKRAKATAQSTRRSSQLRRLSAIISERNQTMRSTRRRRERARARTLRVDPVKRTSRSVPIAEKRKATQSTLKRAAHKKSGHKAGRTRSSQSHLRKPVRSKNAATRSKSTSRFHKQRVAKPVHKRRPRREDRTEDSKKRIAMTTTTTTTLPPGKRRILTQNFVPEACNTIVVSSPERKRADSLRRFARSQLGREGRGDQPKARDETQPKVKEARRGRRKRLSARKVLSQWSRCYFLKSRSLQIVVSRSMLKVEKDAIRKRLHLLTTNV